MALPDGVEITGQMKDGYEEILSDDAVAFLADLHRNFNARRLELLQAREDRYAELAAGGTLDFLEQTKDVREGDWQVARPAPGLEDRRVEITGPTDRKMTINALNSGAKVWLADFEDASTPTWKNVVEGQLNLRDALDRTIDFTSPEGKSYALGQELATIVVRPRGWHLPEKHLTVDGQPMSGALVDFGLYLVHCGRRQIDAGRGPYFYLPKMESHLEARLWNDVFLLGALGVGLALTAMFAQNMVGLIAVVAISLSLSLMFPTIYGVALQGLGEDTKFGAAGLVMAILGGALMPPLMGRIMDSAGAAAGFIVPAVCLTFVTLYALFDLRTRRNGGPLVSEGAH